MKKNILTIFIGILLIGLISASPLSPVDEFFSEDVTQLEITISQTESTANLFLNTSGTSFDTIEYEFEGWFINFPISSFLNGIDGEIEVQEGMYYPQFNHLNIFGEVTKFLIDNSFLFLNIPFTVQEINDDRTILNDYLKDNPLPIASDRDAKFTKDGNNYVIWNNRGYGDIPENYLNKIREIITETLYSINIQNLVSEFMPVVDDELNFLKDLDLNYTVGAIHNIKLIDGGYTINVSIEHEGVVVNKTIILTLTGIKNSEIIDVNETYIPTQPEIQEVITQITGLGSNTITIYIFDEPPKPVLEETKAFKYFDITVSNQTSAELTFKLELSDVTNPELVSLYIWEDSWEKLNTELINETDFYEYKAEIPHFSLFMIAEEKEITTETSTTTSTGGRCKTTWECSEWSTCVDGLQTRECAKVRLGCKTTDPKPDESRICTISGEEEPTPTQLIGEGSEAEETGFARITGAVIGAATSPTGIIIIVFVVALAGVFAVTRRSLRKRDTEKPTKKAKVVLFSLLGLLFVINNTILFLFLMF